MTILFSVHVACMSVNPSPMPFGLRWQSGKANFKLWAPHAASVALEVKQSEEVATHQLTRQEDSFEKDQLDISPGDSYRIVLTTSDGRQVYRRDPYARGVEASDSFWCVCVEDSSKYKWKCDWKAPTWDQLIIYEMHVGSFTEEGTFEAAEAKLDHLADLGFTAIEVMPITEFDSTHDGGWGYNPRQLLATHPKYGSADQFRHFVDQAHERGIAVIVDVVLHHPAVEGNILWDFDGWSQDNNGGIYHEGAPDTQWGRGYAWWKSEVIDLLTGGCLVWLDECNCDGLRFDSALDIPTDVAQKLTHRCHELFPGKILIAEVTPENPKAIYECGFDSLWIHSSYFDIIQQHRALGRGHHGGGDWASGWDIPKLRTAFGMHYGFSSTTQTVKYFLGSHDQCGCRHGGGHYEDYKEIGGQHRYAVDQYGFCGRPDGKALAAARMWYSTMVSSMGLPMCFMGTEWAQPGWWDCTPERRISWDLAKDTIGMQMMSALRDIHRLRAGSGALRYGGTRMLHEDRPNGVIGFERCDGKDRYYVLVNAGLKSFGKYGAWAEYGVFQEVFCSQSSKYGGKYDDGKDIPSTCNEGSLSCNGGTLTVCLPRQCTFVFSDKSFQNANE